MRVQVQHKCTRDRPTVSFDLDTSFSVVYLYLSLYLSLHLPLYLTTLCAHISLSNLNAAIAYPTVQDGRSV